MPVNTACEHCGQQLQVQDEHLGKQVRCPKCYQVFVAKAVAAGAGVPAASVPAPMPAAKFCPHCGQALAPGAAFCAGCGKSPTEAPPAVSAPSPVAGAVSVPSPAGGAVSSPSFPQNVPAPYGPTGGTSGLATASLVLGLLGVVMCFGPVTGIPAVICGHMAKGQIRNSGGTLQGDGLATWGLILGYISIVLSCLFFVGIASSGHRHHP